MRTLCHFLLLCLIFFPQISAAQTQFFPPQGPCTKDRPLLAWNGTGHTYCTSFPTASLPDCPDGQFLTKKKGQLICSDITGKVVTVPVVTQPIVVQTPVVTNYCPSVSVPSCGAGYMLVDYGVDANGCQTSPRCEYTGYNTYDNYDVYTPVVYDTYVETGYDAYAPVEEYYEQEPSYAYEPVYDQTSSDYDCSYYGDC